MVPPVRLSQNSLSTPLIPQSWGIKKEELRDTLRLPAGASPALLWGHPQIPLSTPFYFECQTVMALEMKQLDTRLALRAIITPGGIQEA
jgi:hypothetical protein